MRKDRTIQLRIPAELDDWITSRSKALGLSRSAIARMMLIHARDLELSPHPTNGKRISAQNEPRKR